MFKSGYLWGESLQVDFIFIVRFSIVKLSILSDTTFIKKKK